MKGFPQFFATKQDYLNVLPLYPEETKQALRNLKDDRFVWERKDKVASIEAGVNDDTHKVLACEEKDKKGNEVEEFYQFELVEDANARVFQLGFTLEEIDGIVG